MEIFENYQLYNRVNTLLSLLLCTGALILVPFLLKFSPFTAVVLYIIFVGLFIASLTADELYIQPHLEDKEVPD